MSSRPYSIPLKYRDFMDEEIQQVEDVGIISRSMSDWAIPILVVPKKPMSQDPSPPSKKQFNLRLCIDYRKLNSQIIMARQVKSNGTLGKVVANYPLPTIDTLLARFKGCKYFSTLNLRSGYYHIKLTKEASAKMAFITDKGKWQFHLLPFRINLGPSTFSYVLGTTLKCCQVFALNYLDDIIIISKTWKEHLEHLKEVFKALQEADLKIKQSKCGFFKLKVHYLGYPVGVDGVETLPEKLEAIQKLAAPFNVDELRQFLGLTGFYRKFVPFYADITQCLTKLLRKGIRYEWSDQCKSTVNTLIEELCKAPTHQYPELFRMLPTIVIQASYIKPK